MINLHTDIDIKSVSISDAHKKIDGINLVARHFYGIKNFDECKYCAENALEMAEEINYMKGIGEAKHNFGMISFKDEDYLHSIQNLIEARQLFESIIDFKNLAKVSYQLGLAYWQIGDYGNESECFFKALDLHRQMGNTKDEGNCLNSIGNYFVETGDYESSLEYHRMSLNIKRKIKDIKGIIYSLYNIALIHNNIAAFTLSDMDLARIEYKKSLKYYSEALEFNNKFEKDTFLEKRILQNIALNYSNCGEPEKSLQILLDCVDYFTKAGNDADKCDTIIYLGIIYSKMNNFKKAEDSFLNALKIAERLHSDRHSVNLYKSFSEMYTMMENYKSALFYARKRSILALQRNKTLTDNNLRKLNVLHKVDITKKETEVLSERNDNLRLKNLDLIKLNSEKNYFLNLAANDLKIPLERITNSISIIRNKDKDKDKDNKPKSLNEILMESSHMQKIISELLSKNELDTVQ